MSMSYNFLKSDFESALIDNGAEFDALANYIAFKDNSFILRHNIEAIRRYLRFLKSSNNIFILNGFMGSGKTYTSDVLLDFISDDVLVFRNSYQEAINLDDVLISLFKDFSIYHNDKKIKLPKAESNIFSEKINAYIKYCDAPMLFIFDSFEINTRSKDTQKDILDFINYLSHFEKIKILICSRSFKQADLISDTGVVSHTLTSLSKEEMLDYLNIYNITGSKYEQDELYKVTRGHYVLLELSVLLMNLLHINLTVFSNEYKKSTRNFLEFLISKIFSISSDKFIKILVFMALIRHGISEEFILENELATEEDIIYMLQKRIIAEKFGLYYLKDYIKNEYVKTISAETKIKVHEYLINLYEEELPLKPFERGFFLSRQTMRQEIAFHKNKIDKLNEEFFKSGRPRSPEMKDFNYFTYSQNSGYKKEAVKQKRYMNNMHSQSSLRKNRYTLSKEEALLLNSSSQTNLEKEFHEISKVNPVETQISKENTNLEDSIPKSLDDYVEIAIKYEDAFNFSSAILYYKKALSYTNDIMFTTKEPIIYSKIAICYKRLQNYEEAVNMYEKAYEIYYRDSVEKADEILISIAQIYSEVYKFDKVKEIYNRILYADKGCPPTMSIRVYLDLAEIENNNLDLKSAANYLKKALNEAEKLSDISLLTECYFKFALMLDDNGDLDLAQKYYLRCIQTSNNAEENIYLSSAYSNLAAISSDKKNYSAAKMYYELSAEADKKSNNYEALFYSYSKLAELYKKDSPSKHYEYLVKALSCAKRFDDISYAVAVYIEIGNYYYNISDYKHALKSFTLAKDIAPVHISDKVKLSINDGINKIKLSLGDTEYLKILSEIKKKK